MGRVLSLKQNKHKTPSLELKPVEIFEECYLLDEPGQPDVQ